MICKWLETATAQEVFDKAYLGLIKQGKKSINNRCDCVYRSPDGSKCAAGMLIPDDEFDESFNSYSWDRMVDLHTVPCAHRKLIKAMQLAHDKSYLDSFVEHIKTQFKNIANRFNLTVPELPEDSQ